MNLVPIGNRIIVKREINEQKTNSGLILASNSTNGANVWAEIIALPPKGKTALSRGVNPFIDIMEIGGRVLYRQFQADKGMTTEAVDNFEILEVEPVSGSRQGQVLAYEPPK